VRRVVSSWSVVVVAVRLLAACGDGNVSGEPSEPSFIDQDAYSIGKSDGDPWREPDSDCAEKGGCADVVPRMDTAPLGDAGMSLDVPSRDDAAGFDVPPSLDPCRTREDGTYCAALLGLPTTGLLRCMGNRAGSVTPCPGGCLDRPGATDACLDDSIDPCFDERDGLHCGRSIGASTRPNDAFRCMHRRTTWSGRCPGGCTEDAGGITCAQ
jgi:hypothetical protein